MGVLSAFFRLNSRISDRLTPTHVHEANVFGVYRKVGALLLSHPKVRRVVDCGAGRSWHFPSYYKRWFDIYLIGLDIEADEMAENNDLDEAIVCDVTKEIPVEAGSADLIMVASGIEHFADNESFLKLSYTVLRPHGFLLCQFPGRYAPFAIVNRLLPKSLSRRLINVAMRDDADVLGFTTHYDRTNYSAFLNIAKKAGFDVVYYSPGYYSSSYANFFFPAWILSYLYDMVRFGLGTKNLASYNLFVLQRPGVEADTEPLRLYAWT